MHTFKKIVVFIIFSTHFLSLPGKLSTVEDDGWEYISLIFTKNKNSNLFINNKRWLLQWFEQVFLSDGDDICRYYFVFRANRLKINKMADLNAPLRWFVTSPACNLSSACWQNMINNKEFWSFTIFVVRYTIYWTILQKRLFLCNQSILFS
jgi:hypothetical protein